LGIHNGLNFTVKELKTIGERIVNLNRLFNARFGITRDDDVLPERLVREEAPVGPSKGQVVELDSMLSEYYSYRGWDLKSGMPTRGTLRRLSLEREGSMLSELKK
jgi:aldehyde:ferredoxin oxidoreductase